MKQQATSKASEPSIKPTFRARFFAGVVRHRKLVIAVFLVAAVICAVCSRFVGVNYNMNDYLPPSAASTVALDTMGDEFDGDIPNARVMVRDVSFPEALEYKHAIEDVEGVEDVTWLDDAVSLATPVELIDQDTLETYYKDGCALFSVTVDENARLTAVPAIRDIVGADNHLDGAAVTYEAAAVSTVSEIATIAAFAVAFILIVLILTTTTWIEPFLVLASLGVAVVLNNGSNLMFGTVSFITNAAGSILQIAIALDFSVFLLHRYAECRGKTGSVEGDMTLALCKASTAIISSAATVMIGFLALTVMQFQIGPDLGYALAKGILISLVTTFTFTPALFVCCERAYVKTAHRSFMPSMRKLGSVSAHTCVPLALAFMLLPIPAFLASTSDDIEYMYGASEIFGPETQVGADTQAITQVFGESDTYVLLVPQGDMARERALSDALHDIPQVTSVISYVDAAGTATPSEMADADTLSQLQSGTYSRMVVNVDAAYEGAETFALVNEVRATAQEIYPDEWLLAGEGVSTTDLMNTVVVDKERVDIIAMAAVLFVLLLATRSLSLPVILVFVIETAIWLNFSIPYFTDARVFYLSYLIVSSVQLGVTVDYAILFTDRYKEMRRTCPKPIALRETVAATTIPVLTSGIVLTVVGFVLSFVSSHGILAQLGHYLGVGVLMSLAFVLFVLPGFLYALDGLIAKTTLHAKFVPNRPDWRAEAADDVREGDVTGEREGERSGVGRLEGERAETDPADNPKNTLTPRLESNA
ncbi:MAG: MMPL family transporter [Eggerthellaceae bacterium]|nr:MMPL family transporter [Eggerthellaceae bacterium]